jgi:prefoldin subunit 5
LQQPAVRGANVPEQTPDLEEALAALRAEVATLRAEVAELRAYIGEVPTMECGITSFEAWQRERG